MFESFTGDESRLKAYFKGRPFHHDYLEATQINAFTVKVQHLVVEKIISSKLCSN